MAKKPIEMPKFKNESDEADWWASPDGRAFVSEKFAATRKSGKKLVGSSLVAALNNKASVQIAIRRPETDLQKARKIADRKGIGYQTLLKMLVREGLQREARRAERA